MYPLSMTRLADCLLRTDYCHSAPRLFVLLVVALLIEIQWAYHNLVIRQLRFMTAFLCLPDGYKMRQNNRISKLHPYRSAAHDLVCSSFQLFYSHSTLSSDFTMTVNNVHLSAPFWYEIWLEKIKKLVSQAIFRGHTWWKQWQMHSSSVLFYSDQSFLP